MPCPMKVEGVNELQASLSGRGQNKTPANLALNLSSDGSCTVTLDTTLSVLNRKSDSGWSNPTGQIMQFQGSNSVPRTVGAVQEI